MRLPAFSLEAIQIPNGLLGDGGLVYLIDVCRFLLFGSDLCQFARVEPIAPTVGALIDLDTPFGAEKMPMKFYPRTPWTIPFPGIIHHDSRVSLQVKQRLPRRFDFLIDTLQFEGIEPNAAAAALADIHL